MFTSTDSGALFFPSLHAGHHHPLPTSTCLPASHDSFCYFPFAQFLSASTPRLMYNNMQLTGISFTIFFFKASLYTYTSPAKLYGQNANENIKSSCPYTLQNGSPCVHSISSVSTSPICSGSSLTTLSFCPFSISYASNNKL